VHQLLPGLLGELPFLLPLGELLPEASQVAAVLFQKLVLELRILRAGIHLVGTTARVLVILGRAGAVASTAVCRLIKIEQKRKYG
jgi:hypothetical protein